MNLENFYYSSRFDDLLPYKAKDLNFVKSTTLNDNIIVHIPKNHDINLYNEFFINNSSTSNDNINIYLFNPVAKCKISIYGSNVNFYCFTEKKFNSKFLIYENSNIVIGEDSTANGLNGVTFNSDIFIGKDVMISHNVELQSDDQHIIIDLPLKPNLIKQRNYINIGDHVWLGKRSMILKNVNIGKGSIVGAGSIVTKDVVKYTAVAGNPAKKIKDHVSWQRGNILTAHESSFFQMYGND